MTRLVQILTGIVLIACCLLARAWLEATPIRHMLLQYPMLSIAGALMMPMRFGKADWNGGGVASLLAAIFALAFWMLPRMVDASVASLPVDLIKMASLSGLVGGGFRLGCPHAHPLLRAVLKANAISMLGILAFLYSHAPTRLCSFYLLDDQQRLGQMFLYLAIAIAALWIAPLLVTSQSVVRSEEQRKSPHI